MSRMTREFTTKQLEGWGLPYDGPIEHEELTHGGVGGMIT